MTDDQYNAFKEKALHNGIARRTVSYGDVHLVSDKIVEYSGCSSR